MRWKWLRLGWDRKITVIQRVLGLSCFPLLSEPAVKLVERWWLGTIKEACAIIPQWAKNHQDLIQTFSMWPNGWKPKEIIADLELLFSPRKIWIEGATFMLIFGPVCSHSNPHESPLKRYWDLSSPEKNNKNKIIKLSWVFTDFERVHSNLFFEIGLTTHSTYKLRWKCLKVSKPLHKKSHFRYFRFRFGLGIFWSWMNEWAWVGKGINNSLSQPFDQLNPKIIDRVPQLIATYYGCY